MSKNATNHATDIEAKPRGSDFTPELREIAMWAKHVRKALCDGTFEQQYTALRKAATALWRRILYCTDNNAIHLVGKALLGVKEFDAENTLDAWQAIFIPDEPSVITPKAQLKADELAKSKHNDDAKEKQSAVAGQTKVKNGAAKDDAKAQAQGNARSAPKPTSATARGVLTPKSKNTVATGGTNGHGKSRGAVAAAAPKVLHQSKAATTPSSLKPKSRPVPRTIQTAKGKEKAVVQAAEEESEREEEVEFVEGQAEDEDEGEWTAEAMAQGAEDEAEAMEGDRVEDVNGDEAMEGDEYDEADEQDGGELDADGTSDDEYRKARVPPPPPTKVAKAQRKAPVRKVEVVIRRRQNTRAAPKQEYETEEDEPKPAKKRKAPTAATTKTAAMTKQAAATSRPKSSASAAALGKRAASKSKTAPPKQAAATKRKSVEVKVEEDDDDDAAPSKKPRVRRDRIKSKATVGTEDDQDDDEPSEDDGLRRGKRPFDWLGPSKKCASPCLMCRVHGIRCTYDSHEFYKGRSVCNNCRSLKSRCLKDNQDFPPPAATAITATLTELKLTIEEIAKSTRYMAKEVADIKTEIAAERSRFRLDVILDNLSQASVSSTKRLAEQTLEIRGIHEAIRGLAREAGYAETRFVSEELKKAERPEPFRFSTLDPAASSGTSMFSTNTIGRDPTGIKQRMREQNAATSRGVVIHPSVFSFPAAGSSKLPPATFMDAPRIEVTPPTPVTGSPSPPAPPLTLAAAAAAAADVAYNPADLFDFGSAAAHFTSAAAQAFSAEVPAVRPTSPAATTSTPNTATAAVFNKPGPPSEPESELSELPEDRNEDELPDLPELEDVPSVGVRGKRKASAALAVAAPISKKPKTEPAEKAVAPKASKAASKPRAKSQGLKPIVEGSRRSSRLSPVPPGLDPLDS